MSREFSAPICAGDGEAQRYVGREGAYATRVRAHERILVGAAFPAPEWDHNEVAQADPNRLQSLSARASLHARARSKWCAKHPKTARFEGAAAQSSGWKRQ